MRFLRAMAWWDWLTIAELAFLAYEARHHHWGRWIVQRLRERRAAA